MNAISPIFSLLAAAFLLLPPVLSAQLTDDAPAMKGKAVAAPAAAGGAAAPQYRLFRMTNYYLTKLNTVEEGTEGGVDILDLKGKRVATVTAKSKKALDIEGTGYWEEGGGVKYAHWQDHATSNEGNKYKVDSKYPKGLEAFRTVAVDLGNKPNKDKKLGFKKGKKFQIQELVGLALPDGTTHDGWVTATDTGGNIAGLHFDFFCGTREWGKEWEKSFKSKAKTQAGGFLVNVTWDGVEAVPADYAYGLEKTPPSSRPPEW